jgi:hypothetical protein
VARCCVLEALTWSDMQKLFEEWLPDQPSLNNNGMTLAKNTLPGIRGYRQFPSVAPITDAINARARGAIATKDKAGAVSGYVGNATKLYSVGSTTHTDVTNTGAPYALGTNSGWSFARWGEQVLAVAIEEAPQEITLGGANFADLAGSPPKARYIAVIGDFAVLANINDGTARPETVRWSAINDITDWTHSSVTQSDEQELRSNEKNGGGHITGITGGDEYGVIIREYTVHKMTYVGTPLIFRFDETLPGIGSKFPNSITQEGRLTHFLGNDGFYQLIDGEQVKKIGEEKVDKWFFSEFDVSYEERIVAASDPRSSMVIWIFPGQSNVSGAPNRYIAYNWVTDRWAHGEIDLEWIYPSISAGYTLEELDNINASIDALGVSLDSNTLKGGQLQLAVYDQNQKKGLLTNTALSACLETGDVQLNPEGRSFITGVRPLIESGTSTVQVGARNLQSGAITWGTEYTPQADTGKAYARSNSRYHRIRVNITGNFSHALGVDIDVTVAGGR